MCFPLSGVEYMMVTFNLFVKKRVDFSVTQMSRHLHFGLLRAGAEILVPRSTTSFELMPGPQSSEQCGDPGSTQPCLTDEPSSCSRVADASNSVMSISCLNERGSRLKFHSSSFFLSSLPP